MTAKLSDFGSLSSLLSDGEKKIIQDREKSEYRNSPGKGEELVIQLDNKNRRGKTVTIITGVGRRAELRERLVHELKTACGVGGTSKDGDIILQGDQRKPATAHLTKLGFAVVTR